MALEHLCPCALVALERLLETLREAELRPQPWALSAPLLGSSAEQLVCQDTQTVVWDHFPLQLPGYQNRGFMTWLPCVCFTITLYTVRYRNTSYMFFCTWDTFH